MVTTQYSRQPEAETLTGYPQLLWADMYTQMDLLRSKKGGELWNIEAIHGVGYVRSVMGADLPNWIAFMSSLPG